jgi:Rps23 Pro-64 3,4-dihydroxylase Tpa1-like proline 4-hydroxylase
MSFIYEISNTLPKELCDHIIQEYESDTDKRPGGVGSKSIVRIDLKKSTDLSFKFGSKWDAIHLILRNNLVHRLSEYFKHINDNVLHSIGGMDKILNPVRGDKIIFTNMQVQKYEVGDYFKWHIDVSITCYQRYLAFIWYLNTLEDGGGGETEFIDGTVIKPETGKLLIFPVTWTNIHRCVDIKKGSKYIVTGFVLNSEPTRT